MSKRNILITGGAGFIGSNLIDKLLAQNKKIITIDNFNNYYDPQIKKKNILEIKENMKKINISQNNFRLYREDIRDKEALHKIFKKNNIDIIIHLAAMAGVRSSIMHPDLYYEVNVQGTLNLLEEAKENKIKNFIFGSSSSVYGNNQKVPFSEVDSVDQPISPYAVSKKAGELLCYTYHNLYNLNVACLRFFTVYGPRQRPDLAIRKFTKLILEDKPIPFYGDGTTERDYTYIDDIIDGIIKTIEWLKKDINRYEIFNLGESRTISLTKLVETIEKVLNKRAILEKLPMQPGDVVKTFADINKAKEILGYNPNTRFEKGLADFIKWLGVDNLY